MIKWLKKLFHRHEWQTVQVINYQKYWDSRYHYEKICKKCGQEYRM